MGKSVTLAMKVVESCDWTQNVYLERDNFVGEGVPVIHLVFKINQFNQSINQKPDGAGWHVPKYYLLKH